MYNKLKAIVQTIISILQAVLSRAIDTAISLVEAVIGIVVTVIMGRKLATIWLAKYYMGYSVARQHYEDGYYGTN